MSDLPAPPPGEPVAEDPHARWKFLRDVSVFQLKLLLGNVHNLIFVPVSLVAAGADLLSKRGSHGSRFYKVMAWARDGEEVIDLYSPLREQNERRKFSVDSAVAKIEAIVVREYEKGGTAASVKAAVDRALDKMQREAPPARFDPEEIVKRAAQKIRRTMGPKPP